MICTRREGLGLSREPIDTALYSDLDLDIKSLHDNNDDTLFVSVDDYARFRNANSKMRQSDNLRCLIYDVCRWLRGN